MKKYLLIALFGLVCGTANAYEVAYCANGKCENIPVKENYPQIYTTVYGIFKNAISADLGICDSDSNFKECLHNGIRYLGQVGASETNFSVTGMRVIDTRINPVNRNLEIINDYYTFVNGNRVVCSAAMDTLTLKDRNVSLVTKDTPCPYNMQFKSKNSHNYKIRLIDLDRKIMGIEYDITDYYGAKANPKGYALINFERVPGFNYASVNKAIMENYNTTNNTHINNGYYQDPNKGYNYAVGVAQSYPAAMYNQNLNPSPNVMGYQKNMMYDPNNMYNPNMPHNQMMNGGQNQNPNMMPKQPTYKSTLPYPWGYYYPPEGAKKPGAAPQQKDAKRKIIEIEADGSDDIKPVPNKNYSVGPIPSKPTLTPTRVTATETVTVVEETVQIPTSMVPQPAPAAPAPRKVVVPAPAPVAQPVTAPAPVIAPAPPAPVVPAAPVVTEEKDFIGVFDEEIYSDNANNPK